MSLEILEAAKRLYEETGDTRSITLDSVVDLTVSRKPSVRKFLRHRYQGRMNEISEEYDLKPPFVALLREEIVGMLPFLEERKKWKHFTPSNGDWARYTRLPLEIGPEVAELFGIAFWDYSCIHNGHESNPKYPSYYLALTSQNRNTDFYLTHVKPAIKSMFNIDATVTTDENYPEVRICSKAVVTWFLHDLGFPDFQVPYHSLHYYFDGQIAVAGNVTSDGALRLYDPSHEKLRGIKRLGEGFGFHPSCHKDEKYVYFPKADFLRMKPINPYHAANRR